MIYFHGINNNTDLFRDCVKLVGSFASVVNLVPFNPLLFLHQELINLYFYYQYAQMTSY